MTKFFLLLALLTLWRTPVLFAHETKSDNGIGAILHVDPGDAPVAGQPSTLFFEFTDMEERLDLVNCDCEIVIKRGEQEILKESFTGAEGTSATSGMVDFVFPESDVYKAIVTGTPKEEGQFKPFNLAFLIRVEKTGPATITEAHNQPHNTWQDHALHYLPTGLVILGLILALAFVKKKKRIVVILLALALVGHSIPIKAIHASHEGILIHESFACCLPVSAVMPEEPQMILIDEFKVPTVSIKEVFSVKDFNFYLSIRSPPTI